MTGSFSSAGSGERIVATSSRALDVRDTAFWPPAPIPILPIPGRKGSRPAPLHIPHRSALRTPSLPNRPPAQGRARSRILAEPLATRPPAVDPLPPARMLPKGHSAPHSIKGAKDALCRPPHLRTVGIAIVRSTRTARTHDPTAQIEIKVQSLASNTEVDR